MIKKLLLFQILVGLGLLSLRLLFFFSIFSFVTGFLFAQIYAAFFLYLAQLLVKRKKRRWVLSVISFKWVLLIFILYGILRFMEPLGFFIGLISMPSFFITFAVLERNK